MKSPVKQDLLLSLCMVTCDVQRALKFLGWHASAFESERMELLVFCDESSESLIREKAVALKYRVKVCADGIRSGPNRKRNILAGQAAGKYLMFLDDDSLFQEPTKGIPELLNVIARPCAAEWLLFKTSFLGSDQVHLRDPSRFGVGKQGSGIEWNQVISRRAFERVGGWHPDFCTGERWKSGGMLLLMFKLRAAGYRQECLKEIVIEHPLQIDGDLTTAVRKGLRYRYATGAVVAASWHLVSPIERLFWLARLVFAPLLTWIPALLKGRWKHAVVRMGSPFAASIGLISYFRSRKQEPEL